MDPSVSSPGWQWLTLLWTAFAFFLHVFIAGRAVYRPHRQPAARIAWVVVIFVFPFAGIVGYLLLGETNIGRKRIEWMKRAEEKVSRISKITDYETPGFEADVPDRFQHLFHVGTSVNGFHPVGGNRGKLMPDSNATIESMIADIDKAERHVHSIFYIWLTDRNGLAMVEALKRAASRGVTVRAMADAMGSSGLIRSRHWQEMQDAGVHLAEALPVGNPLIKPFKGRIDLRNHRKILVVDNTVTYCGSQNCADPEFAIKAKYAPWIDAMIRFEGPVVRQNQHLFAMDWMGHVPEDDLSDVLSEPDTPVEEGFTAQAIGTGPTIRTSAMPEIFETLIFEARNELLISTPYYVPDESMQGALCACARRGVDTRIIFPARNDSFVVGAASRSYYRELIDAGVQIYEYEGGLLHTKSLTLDGEISLIGSANMDRRSFELNYENNILFHDPELTAAFRERQETYLEKSRVVTAETVAAWPIHQQLVYNFVGMLGPVL